MDDTRTTLTDVVDLVASASLYGSEELHDIDPVGFDQHDDLLEDLVRHYHAAKVVKQAADEVVRHFRERIGLELGPGGAMRYGDTIIRHHTDTRKRVLVEPEALVEFLGPEAFARSVNPSHVRITSVRAEAEARGLNPDAVEDTFYGWRSEPRADLKELPISKAPKYLQELSDGQVIMRTSHEKETP